MVCMCVYSMFAVFYAFAVLGDEDLHHWLRDPDRKGINTFLFMVCEYAYGLGMYILMARQWQTSFFLPVLLGPGAQAKVSSPRE